MDLGATGCEDHGLDSDGMEYVSGDRQRNLSFRNELIPSW